MGSEAFEDWVPVHSPRLLRTAWLLTGDTGLAEDLVQSALIKCWQRWDRVAALQDPYAYVQQVMTRIFLAWWRRKWRGELATDQMPDTAVADSASSIAERASLTAALRRLPPGQRAAIVLRFAEDRSEKQTAQLLGCTVGTVKRQVHRGLRALRSDAQLLQEVGIDDH